MPETRYIIKHMQSGKFVKVFEDTIQLVDYSGAQQFRLPAAAYSAVSKLIGLDEIRVDRITIYDN